MKVTNETIMSFSEEQENVNTRGKMFYDMKVFLEFLVTDNVCRKTEETNPFKIFSSKNTFHIYK